MGRIKISASLLAVALALVWGASDALGERIPPEPVDGTIQWVYSYDEGKALARTSGKPLFVVFRCER